MEESKQKVKVVGWVDYDDGYFPSREKNDADALDAIVEEIRAHGYLFGGDAHQDKSGCTPVLSDGTKAIFSWRGWGYVIAVAYDLHGADGKYDHLCGYMDDMIKPEARRYPVKGVDFSAITVKGKKHVLCYAPSMSERTWLSLDMRADGEDTAGISVGDYVGYTTKGAGGYCFNAFKVTRIYRDKNFENILDGMYGKAKTEEEMFAKEAEIKAKKAAAAERIMAEEKDKTIRDYKLSLIDGIVRKYNDDRFNALAADKFGYPGLTRRSDMLEALYKDYPREEEEKRGAVCLELHCIRDEDDVDFNGLI